MTRLFHASPFNRRLLSVLVLGALLAALVLVQGPVLRGRLAVNRGPATLPILVLCTAAQIGWIDGTAQPTPPGRSVTLTAFSSTCDVPEYRFMVLAPGSSTWVFKTAYTSSHLYIWNTTGAQPGVWLIGVWAREAGTAYRYNAYAIGTFLIGIHYCEGAQMGADAVSPLAAGTPIQIHILAFPIDCQTPSYKFFEMVPGSSTWVMVADWAVSTQAAGSYTWDITGTTRGLYRWAVWVRDAGSTRKYDSYAMSSFWIT
jgi:hypothetical protein